MLQTSLVQVERQEEERTREEVPVEQWAIALRSNTQTLEGYGPLPQPEEQWMADQTWEGLHWPLNSGHTAPQGAEETPASIHSMFARTLESKQKWKQPWTCPTVHSRQALNLD